MRTAEESLAYFASRRTDHARGSTYQGVQTPSQARYVAYYEKLINDQAVAEAVRNPPCYILESATMMHWGVKKGTSCFFLFTVSWDSIDSFSFVMLLWLICWSAPLTTWFFFLKNMIFSFFHFSFFTPLSKHFIILFHPRCKTNIWFDRVRRWRCNTNEKNGKEKEEKKQDR